MVAGRRPTRPAGLGVPASTRPPSLGLPIVFDLASDAPVGGAPGATGGKRHRKTSEIVAGDVVRDIVSRGLQVGNHLPAETAMLAQYGVGRESLREALRLLEVQGLIKIKRGPGGGPVVTGVDPAYLARTAALYFHLSGATYDEVFETWQVLEPAVAAQVASLPDREEVRRLLVPHCEELPEGSERQEFLESSNGFHALLAQLSGSRVLVLFLRAISHIVVEHVVLGLDPVEERQVIEDDHTAIARAVVDGHPDRAHQLMTDHIKNIRDTYAARWAERMQDLVEWR